MTIKAFVLDALSKFLTKLKSTYLTPMQDDIDEITIYASTYAEFYNKITALELKKTVNFNVESAVASVITDSHVSSNFKGTICKMDDAQNIFDYVGFVGTDGYTCYGRIRCTSQDSSGCVIQARNSAVRVDGASIRDAGVSCQFSSDATRFVTQSFYLADGLSDYNRVQLIVHNNAIKVLGRRRSDDGNETVLVLPTLLRGTKINENTNIDSLTTLGTYYCKASATAATLTNCPIAVAFTMHVSYATGEGYIRQSIYPYDSAASYHRTLFSNGWGAWTTPAQNITGAASTIATSNLTASRALVSDSNGKVNVLSAITTTELGYLDGVTSAIQTQLDGKAVKSHSSTATTYGLGNASRYGHVKLSDTYKSKTTDGDAANGLGASQNALFNVYDSFVTQDYTFTGNYSAGTIGTRGWQGTQTIASPYSGYTVISVFIIDIGDSSATHPLAFLYSGKVYCNFYRATAAAVSSNTVKVRVLFKK